MLPWTGLGFRQWLALSLWLVLPFVAARPQSDDPLKLHYEAAGKFLQSGDHDHAAAEYKSFLAEALHRVANGKAGVGQFDSAEPIFEEVLAFSPSDMAVQFDYAKACFDADKLLKAKALAQNVAASGDADRPARFLLARVLFHLGEFEPAQQQLETVFAERPEFKVGFLLAKTYLLLHQDQAARDLLDGMAENFGDTAQNRIYFGRIYSETDHQPEAIAEFQRAMAEDPHAPDVHYYLGLAYLGHNESAGYAQALPEFRAELQLNPNDFRSHYMMGYIALRQRNFPEAERELSNALASQPRDVQSILDLTEAYVETGRVPEAEKEARAAITIASTAGNDVQASRAHYIMGRILEKTGHPQEAAQEMKIVADIQKRLGPSSAQVAGEKATKEVQDQPKPGDVSPEKLAALKQFVAELAPAVADAYANLGAISASGRDFSTAAKYYQSARSWDAARPDLDRSLGLAFFYSEQYADAAPPLRRFLHTQPNDLLARSVLALSLYKTGDFRRVIETLQPVSSQISGDRSVTSVYADSYYQLGKFQLEASQVEAAVISLEAAAKLNPQNSAVHAQLAEAYRRAGRESDAQKEERMLQSSPSP